MTLDLMLVTWTSSPLAGFAHIILGNKNYLGEKMSNANYLLVKDKVQRFAKQMFNIVELNDDGSLSIPYESTHVFVEVYDVTSDDQEFNNFKKENDLSFTAISVWAMVLLEVKPSADLFKWIAIDGQTYDYGGFKAVEREDGKLNLIFRTALPGDNLDAGELKEALLAVASVADGNDEDLKARFGGLTVANVRN